MPLHEIWTKDKWDAQKRDKRVPDFTVRGVEVGKALKKYHDSKHKMLAQAKGQADAASALAEVLVNYVREAKKQNPRVTGNDPINRWIEQIDNNLRKFAMENVSFFVDVQADAEALQAGVKQLETAVNSIKNATTKGQITAFRNHAAVQTVLGWRTRAFKKVKLADNQKVLLRTVENLMKEENLDRQPPAQLAEQLREGFTRFISYVEGDLLAQGFAEIG